MQSIVSIANLSKTYASGFKALANINLDIRRGEIFALLGPNGAGKTTLINIICGIVMPSDGSVSVDGHDIIDDYRAARSMIGLVPQELHTDAFETVWATVSFSRGLFGKPADADYLAKMLKDLALCSVANGKHGDHGRYAKDDSQTGKQGPHLVCRDGIERDRKIGKDARRQIGFHGCDKLADGVGFAVSDGSDS